jgi:hypothetical protein
MFQRIEGFYTQEIRIDLVAASQMAKLNPNDPAYCAAAERGAYIVSVLQGDNYEGFYGLLLERTFDKLDDAKSFFNLLALENPDAKRVRTRAETPGT